MFNSKVFAAEFIGTFGLVFIGAGAGVAGAGLVGVALAHGLTLAVFVYAFGYISGTHINPAVTFGLALQGAVKWTNAIFSYWIPQFLGGILAAYFLNSLVSPIAHLGFDISSGATVGALTDTNRTMATLLEAVLTFFLVNTVLHTAVGGRGGQFAGLAIGLTLSVAILVGGPLTGASLNPARTFGPAIFTGPSFSSVYTYIIYLFGPLFGATVAVMAYQFFMDEETLESKGEAGEVKGDEAVEEKTKMKPAARKSTNSKTTTRKTVKK